MLQPNLTNLTPNPLLIAAIENTTYVSILQFCKMGFSVMSLWKKLCELAHLRSAIKSRTRSRGAEFSHHTHCVLAVSVKSHSPCYCKLHRPLHYKAEDKKPRRWVTVSHALCALLCQSSYIGIKPRTRSRGAELSHHTHCVLAVSVKSHSPCYCKLHRPLHYKVEDKKPRRWVISSHTLCFGCLSQVTSSVTL